MHSDCLNIEIKDEAWYKYNNQQQNTNTTMCIIIIIWLDVTMKYNVVSIIKYALLFCF